MVATRKRWSPPFSSDVAQVDGKRRQMYVDKLTKLGTDDLYLLISPLGMYVYMHNN